MIFFQFKPVRLVAGIRAVASSPAFTLRRRRCLRMLFLLSILGPSLLQAQVTPARNLESIPPYGPRRAVSGVIEIWGSPGDASLLDSWQSGFRHFQPGVTFVDKMRGPDSTMAGIYTGVAQIAFLSREIWPVEEMAFRWVYQYKPSSVQIMTAGLKNNRVSASLVVIVNRANPITQLSLTQLDSIFGAEPLRGGMNIRTWGKAGATGTWSTRPIHVYGPAIDSAPAFYFNQEVLKNSGKWNCSLKEFGSERDPMLAKIAQSVAGDPDGIGYAVMHLVTPGVRTVALSAGYGQPAVPPAEENVRTRAYPLSRALSMYFSQKPGTAVDPKVAEFLLYILSRQGQAAVARDGAYFPLTGPLTAAQRARLQ